MPDRGMSGGRGRGAAPSALEEHRAHLYLISRRTTGKVILRAT
ncbi:hypothetical protein ABZW49_29320 [Nonomuraea wenchangensis]